VSQKNKNIRSNDVKGFTLVETAIVLVIIGLLVGATITSQQLIAGAQAKRTAAQARDVTIAYLVYFDRYQAIPGDDARASARWPGAKDGSGDGRISGVFDAVPPADPAALVVSASEGENLNFWWHLRLAGLINGSSSDASPAAPLTHPLGGHVGVQQDAYGMRGAVLCMAGLPSGIAGAVDAVSDDEHPARGAIRSAPQTGGAPLAAHSPADVDHLLCVSLTGSSGGAALAFDGSAPDAGGSGPVDAGSGGDAGGATGGDAGGTAGDAGGTADTGGGGTSDGWGGGGYGGGWGGGGHWGGGGGHH
jgi:prepilin-type N-terminal cleavage/methylation domain-containing protein